ncbi:MAG TPA: M20/M25/M40 family metallo-hydrolase [Gemmatimonadales bacterium]|jgi:hypothetical protein
MTTRMIVLAVFLIAARSAAPALPGTATAGTDTLHAVPAPDARDHANIERLERVLADDSMEGRGTATPGGERAARFLAGEMQRIGLKRGGDSGFLQRVPMMVPAPAGSASETGRGRGARLMTLPSLADLDTVPLDRRRHAENVVGILPGGDPALSKEVVLVLSHYDHLGVRTPAIPGGDSIYNGADDDASGTVAVLEVARLLRRAGTPRRTIIFANMTGEEVGLLGTNFFIAHPPVPLTQIVAGFEIEMIGRPDSLAGGPGKAWLTGYERSTMGDMLKEYGIAIVPDMRPDQRFFTRSDNYGLARRGIVAHTLSSFNLHSDYHQVTDEVSKIDFDHMTAVIHSAAEAVRHLADGPRPEWHPGGAPR